MANSNAVQGKSRGDKAHQQQKQQAKQQVAVVEVSVNSLEATTNSNDHHNQQQLNGNSKVLNKNVNQIIVQNNSETKQQQHHSGETGDAVNNNSNNKKQQTHLNPIDIACNHESLNSIVRDLDAKIANLEKKIQGKPNKANDLKHSGSLKYLNNNVSSRLSSNTNLDNDTTSDDDDDDAEDEEQPIAIVVTNKNDPLYQHLESLKKIRSNIMASISVLETQKKTALKFAQVDTMRRNVDDINKLKWLLTIKDTLKHFNEEAKKELLSESFDEETQETKEPLLTEKQLELIEKSIPFICPSRIDFESKFSVQLDTSSKFIMHLYEGKRKEALPGINFKNLKDLLKKISDAPYFSDRQKYHKSRNNSPDENITNIPSEQTMKQETASQTNGHFDQPTENKPSEEDKQNDEPPSHDNKNTNLVNNPDSAYDTNKATDDDSAEGGFVSLQPDDGGDSIQEDQPKNEPRASHGYPQRKVYDNSRGRSSRGGNGSRYNDRRRNYSQYDRKEFPQKGSDGAERPEYGNQKPRQSSQRYKHSQKNMPHNSIVPNNNGNGAIDMVYSNMQNDPGLVHDPAVIAASLSHPNGEGINVHSMPSTAHSVMYH